MTATTNIGIVLRSGRRSFAQNTGATAVIYSVHTVQFMIISKQDMTYIVVFSMHEMPAAFLGVKDLTELMTMYFISKSIVNKNVLPQMEITGRVSGIHLLDEIQLDMQTMMCNLKDLHKSLVAKTAGSLA